MRAARTVFVIAIAFVVGSVLCLSKRVTGALAALLTFAHLTSSQRALWALFFDLVNGVQADYCCFHEGDTTYCTVFGNPVPVFFQLG